MPAPLLLAVDGNSLLHRAHHAWADSLEFDDDGRPVWGLLGLVVAIAACAARCEPDGIVVGFDCGQRSVRRESYAPYKAHRPDKPMQLQWQLDDAPELLSAAGFPVAQVQGYEADDVLASAAALARREGWRCVLATSDRDAFALIDSTTSVLRVVNGGIDGSPLLTPVEVLAEYGVDPAHYRDLAALRGDPSDNLPGVAGIGGRTAARLLTAFPGLEAVHQALDDGRADAVRAVVGAAAAELLASTQGRVALEQTRTLMTQREDLPLPSIDDLRLPLDGARMRTTLAQRGIRLGRALWALVGEERPPWSPNGFDKAPTFLPRVEDPPWALSRWAHLVPAVAPGPPEAVGAGSTGPPRDGSDTTTRRPRHPRRAVAMVAGQLALF